MEKISNWCNINQGFVSALLTLFSLTLSITAIIVSFTVAKIPYKKKIALAYFTNLGVGLSSGLQFYSIEATNIGNRIIKVAFVGIGYKERGKWKKAYNIKKPNPSNVMLNINETATAQYDIDEINKLMSSKKIYAFAMDIEGKIYKRKMR